jgi:hypothetical protein
MSQFVRPLTDEQEDMLDKAASFLPREDRHAFYRTVRNRLNAVSMFSNRDLQHTIRTVLGSYGVATQMFNNQLRKVEQTEVDHENENTRR